jgi:hypothetical protein
MFDSSLSTIVTTDACGYGLAATLTQIKGGKEVLVACASRTLKDHEKNYSVGEHEALACVWSIEKWHTYLWGNRFTLRTDNKALTTLLTTQGSGHRPMHIAKWCARLIYYDYIAEFKPGVENAVCDAFSRVLLVKHP